MSPLAKDRYSPQEFAELVAREDEIERKTGLGQDALQECLVAMSNTDGGVIFVGVQDDGTVVGRKRDQAADDRIHEAALNARNVGRYEIREVGVGDKLVIAITVARRQDGFSQTSNGRVLVRRGGHNVVPFGDDLAQLLSQRVLRRFESTDSGLALDAASDKLIQQVANSFGWKVGAVDLEARLMERGLLLQDRRLSVAGALFLTDPTTSLRQSKFMIEIRRFPPGSNVFDRREDIRGPVHYQVATATRFLVDELGSDVVVTGVYRHELPRLPEIVVREAVANAVAHRSYEASGTAVIIELTSEAVTITSPGGLPAPVTVANLRQAQAARNQDVIDVLRRFNLAEDAGRGVDVMQDTMQEALLDPPEFQDHGHAVSVSLPLRGPITPRERAWVSDLERRGEIRSPDRLLLVHAARGEVLTNSKARVILGEDRVEARAALQRLRDAELVRQKGERGSARYYLVDDVAPPAAFRISATELDDLVVAAASEQPITNEAVRLITGLERRPALRLLQRLVQEGRLAKAGERRGTRYRPV